MANQTEYIFEKDFWGNWKLVPKKSDSGIGWIILLLIVVVIVCLAIITLPLWLALLGFKMVKTKRYYAGIGSLLALLYFIIDIQNRWITGFLFLGYNDSAGKFTEGLIGEKQMMYVYVANGIGVLLGLYFIVQAYLLNKESNALNNSTSENETSSANSQSSNNFSISTSKPKSSSNQVNLVLGILGVVFAIAVIYFSFNKKVVNNEVPINNIKVNNEQPAINESPINENLNNDVSEKDVAQINQITPSDSVHNSSSFLGNFPYASERLLTSSELIGLNKQDLKIMRNEIFARHGYIFKTTEMKSHFENQTWYNGQYDDVSSFLSIIEKQNIELIKKYE